MRNLQLYATVEEPFKYINSELRSLHTRYARVYTLR